MALIIFCYHAVLLFQLSLECTLLFLVFWLFLRVFEQLSYLDWFQSDWITYNLAHMLFCPGQCLYIVSVVIGCHVVVVIGFLYICQLVMLGFIRDKLVRIPLLPEPISGIKNCLLLLMVRAMIHDPALIFFSLNVVFALDFLLSFLQVVLWYIWRLFWMTGCWESSGGSESRWTDVGRTLVVDGMLQLGRFFRFIIPIVHKSIIFLTSS